MRLSARFFHTGCGAVRCAALQYTRAARNTASGVNEPLGTSRDSFIKRYRHMSRLLHSSCTVHNVTEGVCVQHSLVDDRVSTCLADHKVSPLNDNDGHEERRVARKLQHLALCVRLENNATKRLRNTQGPLTILTRQS